MPFPGDIITIKSCYIDQRNRVLLRDCHCKAYQLAGKHDTNKIRKEVEEAIRNGRGFAICIPGVSSAGLPLVLMKDWSYYRDNLINFFYMKRDHKVLPFPFACYKNIWKERWTQAGSDWENVQCQPIRSIYNKPLQEFNWAEALYVKNGNLPCWSMPVFCSFCTEFDPSQKLRFSPQDPFEDFGYPQPCCYVALDGFPREYEAEITPIKNQNEKRSIRIVLHGFLRPDTAHYKFWTHVVCGSPKADENTNMNEGVEERSYWGGKLEPAIPAKCLFNNCTPHKKAETCKCPSLDQFKNIHEKIRDSFNSYLEEIDTFFTKSETIELIAAKYGDLAYVHVNAIKKEFDGRSWYPRLAMVGICHNWNDQKPILHLYVKTFFRGRKNRLWGEDNYKFKKKHYQAGIRKSRVVEISKTS